MEEKEERAFRRERLYGASRSEGRAVARRLQQEDHILENFQRGNEPFGARETFQSVTATSFRVCSPSAL